MKQYGSLLFAIVLGLGICLSPLRAQDNPPNPPQQQIPAADAAQPQAWTGDLVDATCKAATPSDKCEVSESTKMFGLQTADGNFYRFDGESNSKVMEALASGGKKTGALKVSVNGTMKDGTVTAEKVVIR